MGDRRGGRRDLRKGELEIELPTRTPRYKVSFAVYKRESELDELEHVYVTSKGLVVQVTHVAYWTCDYTGEFRVLENDWERNHRDVKWDVMMGKRLCKVDELVGVRISEEGVIERDEMCNYKNKK
ncbi:hypothetical protein EON65_40330 [archaeon]|nr:MAG: hypothetical protein EON65_40330 [archaeon]